MASQSFRPWEITHFGRFVSMSLALKILPKMVPMVLLHCHGRVKTDKIKFFHHDLFGLTIINEQAHFNLHIIKHFYFIRKYPSKIGLIHLLPCLRFHINQCKIKDVDIEILMWMVSSICPCLRVQHLIMVKIYIFSTLYKNVWRIEEYWIKQIWIILFNLIFLIVKIISEINDEVYTELFIKSWNIK